MKTSVGSLTAPGADSSATQTEQVLVTSTDDLSPGDRLCLDLSDPQYSWDRRTGWMVVVPRSQDDQVGWARPLGSFSHRFQKIINLARRRGCTFVLFDADADSALEAP